MGYCTADYGAILDSELSKAAQMAYLPDDGSCDNPGRNGSRSVTIYIWASSERKWTEGFLEMEERCNKAKDEEGSAK